MNAGENTAFWDCHIVEELVKLVVVANRKLNVARCDAAALVVAGGVASKLENFRCKVLEHGCEVHGCAGTDAGFEVGLLEVAVHAANREPQASLGRPGDMFLPVVCLRPAQFLGQCHHGESLCPACMPRGSAHIQVLACMQCTPDNVQCISSRFCVFVKLK